MPKLVKISKVRNVESTVPIKKCKTCFGYKYYAKHIFGNKGVIFTGDILNLESLIERS